MRRFITGVAIGVLLAASVFAQTPSSQPSSQQSQSPDAKYPNPSGQDSKPNTTPPKQKDPPKSDKPSSSPRTADPQADNGAGKDTYRGATGKKPSTSPGCSTPVQPPEGNESTPSKPSKCTTTGEGAPKSRS